MKTHYQIFITFFIPSRPHPVTSQCELVSIGS